MNRFRDTHGGNRHLLRDQKDWRGRVMLRRTWWILWSLLLLLSACTPLGEQGDYLPATDGGMGGSTQDDLPIVQLPFPAGTDWLCTQGAHGGYSHTSRATQYDVDLDTPNPPATPADMFAPVSGFAWQWESASGFGAHVNIQLTDNTFVVLGHMETNSIPLENGLWVEAGSFIGRAGCTGYCAGSHVHLGVHAGQASNPANGTTSVPFAVFAADTQGWDGAQSYPTEEMVCGLESGHSYESQLFVNPPWQDTPEGDSYDSDPVDAYEGDQAGECEDGADNDQDGDFDCDDTHCVGAPACTPESPEEPTPEPPDPTPEPPEPTPPPDSGDDDDDDDTTESPTPPPVSSTAHELCWVPSGLVNARAGELWVWGGWTWQTAASATGSFVQLCGTVSAASGSTLTLNGEFTADNVPGNPWWICSNTGVGGMVVYGTFWVDGLAQSVGWVSNGVGGCNVELTMP